MYCRKSVGLALVACALASVTTVAEAQQMQCPPGTVAIGSRCEPEERPGRPVSAEPAYGTHADVGLAVAGGVVIGLGYAAQVIFAVLGNNAILYIPIVGGFIHAPLNATGGGVAVGLSVSTSQTLGLIFLIWGLAANHPNEPPRASLEPELVPGPGEAGVGLRWRF